MKTLKHKEKFMILVAISDQLWSDYKSGIINADDYLIKADQIREELNNFSDSSYFEIEELSKSFGYILIKSKNIFSFRNDYKFQKLIIN